LREQVLRVFLHSDLLVSALESRLDEVIRNCSQGFRIAIWNPAPLENRQHCLYNNNQPMAISIIFFVIFLAAQGNGKCMPNSKAEEAAISAAFAY